MHRSNTKTVIEFRKLHELKFWYNITWRKLHSLSNRGGVNYEQIIGQHFFFATYYTGSFICSLVVQITGTQSGANHHLADISRLKSIHFRTRIFRPYDFYELGYLHLFFNDFITNNVFISHSHWHKQSVTLRSVARSTLWNIRCQLQGERVVRLIVAETLNRIRNSRGLRAPFFVNEGRDDEAGGYGR